MKDILHSPALAIILALLTIVHVREIIAKLFHISRKWKYSWIFYGENEKEIAKEILTDLNVDIKKERNEKFLGRYRRREDKEKALIEFISCYIDNTENKYGYKTQSKSGFYINTMEASNNQVDLVVMSEIMCSLIDKSNDKSIRGEFDFIITPKACNVSLGKSIAAKMNRVFIQAKSKQDPSYANTYPEDYLGTLMLNFIGSFDLIKTSKESPNRKLKGILVDCNISGGSHILETMDLFNKIIEMDKDLNIEKVEHAFVLFRVDKDDHDIDLKFRNKGFTINRWFDLTEEIKKEIWRVKNNFKCERLDLTNKKHNEEIDQLISLMKRKNLITQI